MVLRASSPEAKAEWMEAFREAMSDLFSREEIEHKRIAEMELRPMMLKSESLQFERRQIILQNLEVIIGMPDAFEKKGPRTVKQGYLKFERAQYAEQQFFASLMPDAVAEGERWKKYYCALREDATLVYALDSKTIKEAPKGVISLAHLSVHLHMEEIERTGKLNFSLSTPLRSFVLNAPHQVALEEWLKAFVRVVEQVGAKDRKMSMMRTLGELNKMHTDIDLVSLLESDPGLSLYSDFMEKGLAADSADVDAARLWACWQDIREFKELADSDDAGDESALEAKGRMILATYLDDAAPQKLPSDCDEVKKDVAEQVTNGEKVEINLLHIKVAKCLHKKTFNALRQTAEFKELMASMAAAAESEGKLNPEAERLLIFMPQEGEGGAAFDIDATNSKRYKRVGSRIYCTLKGNEENVIGRDKKCQVMLDTDRKVSRQHAKIDCQEDGRCIFSDLGSSRGSKVNGKTVNGRVNLAIGDKIKVGKTEMLFTITDEDKQPIL